MEVLVIMGAAVNPDGSPSGAMRRRVEGALAIGRKYHNAIYIVTGGVGRYGPTEADVMRAELEASGIHADQIESETLSTDTLSSVVNCARLIHRLAPNGVLICSDRYHIPRCRWLFWLLGVSTHAAPMPSGRAANGILKWSYYYLREFAATPLDTLLLLARRSNASSIQSI
jgi:uncharacterized SAM-binding protein YcdF (DUF218 family)